jgi:CDP-diacylglycerol--serine O-phosphatidyltransferase
MIGIYNYTVLLTYMNFISGILGIICATKGNIFHAIVLLMFAGLCDMFDGKVARTKKKRTIEERHFGIQLDSLADVVSFGVLPAIIGYMLGAPLILVVLFPTAGLIRLAWFNVLEITRNSSEPVKSYTGLPITSSAMVFPFLYMLKNILGTHFNLVYIIMMVVVGILFILKIKIKKPGFKTMIGFIIAGIIMFIVMVL